ncbi:juvenile hormone esterase-like isoform X2 [Macrobrachium nipponense]|uniref:juvenile hormone esterase-like isoform X2 n=1 Tax=Macrobrachium nipponense TaxID=159736 RepID=UPI0030C87696
MKLHMNLVFLLAVGTPLLLSGLTSASADVWKVDLEQGSIEAPRTNTAEGTHYYAFKGIPFAKPPVGDLRFKSPLPPGPWSGVRNGSAPSPICPQIDLTSYVTGSLQASGNEDCLYLDVYVPQNASNFPVMVWIHGGGFILGSASDSIPVPLMTEDVVVVTIQYRIGVLGFLSTADSVMSGNYGLKDQVMALRWVQDNIHSFGGDHNRITLFGESAGAMSVHYLMLSPMAKGLFHRAIAQSGTALVPLQWNEDPSREAATLGQMLDCPGVNPENLDSESLKDCLMKVSPEKLVLAAKAFSTFMDSPQIIRPTIDGEFLPEHPAKMLKEGKYHRVNFMTGITRDEGAMFVRRLLMSESMTQDLATNFSAIGPTFLNIPAGPNSSPEYMAKRMFAHYVGGFNVTEENADGAVKMFTDYWFGVPLDIVGKMHARDADYGHKTFLYELHYSGEFSFLDSPNITVGKKWVGHADDLQYLFNSVFQPLATRPTDLFMREVMVSLWTNFARTGNPTPDMSLGFKWLPVSGCTPKYLILQPSPYMKKFSRDKEVEFMTNLPLDYNVILYPERFTIQEN